MMRLYTAVICVALLGAAAIPTLAQPVRVTIDGQPVAFPYAQPALIGGSVLVPFREVVEQMGGEVTWNAPARAVTITQQDNEVSLTVGARTAFINGRPVTLDAPARIIAGTTMVPLRFVGEALGAGVTWQPSARTVRILSGGGVGAGPRVSIESVTHDAAGWIGTGSTLSVDMRATPGGIATFEIPGVIDRVPMREVTPGRYSGAWVIPTGQQLTVSGDNVVATINVGGKRAVAEAPTQISIDTVPPSINSFSPAADSQVTVNRPTISAVIDDNHGSGIDDEDVAITVNGDDVSEDATFALGILTYRPDQALRACGNTVIITARDRAGNLGRRSWSFDVSRRDEAMITEFTLSDVSNLRPGDTVTITMRGEPNGRASFSVITSGGIRLDTRSLREISSGLYRGTYTIPADSNIDNSTISGTLTLPSGQSYTVRSVEIISLAPGRELRQPVITAPRGAIPADRPLIVSGTAPSNSRVRLRVSYSSQLLGVFRSSGQLTDQTIEVGRNGRWSSEPINLTTLIRGRNTRYTISAVTIGRRGQLSPATTITIGGR